MNDIFPTILGKIPFALIFLHGNCRKPTIYSHTNNLNPLMPSSDLEILLCLMPDDFTRRRETPWALKG